MRLAIVGVAFALVLGGCAGGEKPSTAPSLDPDARNLKFAECLREQGLDVPDPEPGKGMMLKFGPDSDQQKVQAAMEACREWAPSGVTGGGAADPKRDELMRKQAQCMRDNGVEAFPDPENGQIRIDASAGEDPDFKAAEKACASIMQGSR
ncbi:hypothetical protein FHR83_004268 [Actinoplanes campanulatus]|uniref:Uncharacterized protein n=1 Tax=Actinoplanes campanulatus TaxID=113559 RepID=A0A7W5FFK4_9ACTN|nr:hypothetical protein [Actinoplanes campanulatus]MBB3096594.1 hypothetical protein [Actinoplanes campanulatus]GGN30072.1 hypothetical protein GCM10010109_49460 [Actinoplanes campanulatus]GID37133.1 hypothetical protein Aca09nite_36390 [Actinoplanes campanulatus]